MTQDILKKFMSAVLGSVMAIGIMVVIVEDGYNEMPYYDGSFVNPINSPHVEALYQANASYSQGSEEVTTYEETAAEGTITESENNGYTQGDHSAYTSRAE